MNILKAFLFTALVIAIDLAINLSIGLLIDTGDYELNALRHYIGIVRIIPYSIAFLIMLLIVFKIKFRWYDGIEKIKHVEYRIILYLIVITVGLSLYDRPSFDFTRILDSLNNLPIEPYVQRERNFISMFYIAFTYLILAPLFEELFFRKYLYVKLKEKYSNTISIIVSSVCFSLIHLPSYRNLIPTFIFGFICCIIYTKTRNIFYTIFLHFLVNLAWFISVYYGGKYYNWILELEFNIIYWSLVFLGVIIIIFGLRKITTANNVYN